jgi:uncharacterized membrane protein YfcA
LLSYGALTGVFSGFFGGGFVIVPGLIASTGMPILNAVGSSLVAVCAFDLTTTLSYALSGYVDSGLAAVFIAGGIAGGQLGAMAAQRSAANKDLLKMLIAGLIFVVATYMLDMGFRQFV